MKKTLIGAAAVALGITGALAFVGPAQATPGDDFWIANDGSKIVNSNTVELTGKNTSVETTKAFPELTVAKDDVLSFEYTLTDDAKCTAGGPRVFVVIDGDNVNTWDQNIPNGEDAACKGTAVFPKAGKVTAAGVVYDNGVGGTVTVSDVKIGNTTVNFKAYEIETLTEIKAPTVTAPTCDATGTVKLPTKQEQAGVKYTAKRNIVDGVTVSATVTAEAEFGYEIKDGVVTTFGPYSVAKLTGEQCETDEQPTTPTETPTKSPVGASLPVTGDGGGINVPLVAAATGVVLIALGAIILIRRRRDAVSFTA